MNADRPTIEELVEAVREFLQDQITPVVEGRTAFHTRVAINVLAVVERELKHGPRLYGAEQERLRRLLHQEGRLSELNAELCRRIREGELDCQNEALIAHLRQTVVGRLAIDNPRYPAYRQALNVLKDEATPEQGV
ncbi:MAG: hypothetical protein JSW39_28400 [Desulfobacterales bacterium]|nr:MAG: hypothetical protein JSW39_28400 [Desulfobacterales bacterium]